MTNPDRYELLFQKLSAGELGVEETAELRELLKSDSDALDRYLDQCQLEEQLAFLHPANSAGPVFQSMQTERPGRRSSGVPAITAVIVALFVVCLAVKWSDTGTGVQQLAMTAPHDRKQSAESGREDSSHRKPNPWKVINSSGAMNHPKLTEVSVPSVTAAADRRIQFNRDIRPILSETCFHCHGPDEKGRRAELRLDTISGATKDRGEYRAITPGDLQASEAWHRIISEDPELMMPPAESHLALSDEQKVLIRRWIEQGAVYEGHWAFIPPQAPEVPDVNFADAESQATWSRGAIDSFVAARLAEAGMSPSPEADPRVLIRRLTLDLTGLPPTVEETRNFVREYSAGNEAAYQETVSRLLKSPHFGERMAVPWLDQARYADTNGYSIDGGRDMWLWRDWVIQAYNDNMPFDRFLTEQLAGDLLPDATDAQRIATGFNRNHMITHEGGTIPAENLTNYVADRVKTTGEVFLGLTMGCAQCHDHKYDPISQKEYYQFFAFFNELEDRGLDGNSGINATPSLMTSTVLRDTEADELG